MQLTLMMRSVCHTRRPTWVPFKATVAYFIQTLSFLRMYNKMWHQTQEALNSLLDKESQNITQPHRSQVFIFQTLATFYIKYVQIFRNLENAYDQIVHPQKRILIRKVLDGVMGRILELKNEMVNLELTEFHYFDDVLQDLKLAPVSAWLPSESWFPFVLDKIRGAVNTQCSCL